MPTASIRIAVAVKPGDRHSPRNANRTSLTKLPDTSRPLTNPASPTIRRFPPDVHATLVNPGGGFFIRRKSEWVRTVGAQSLLGRLCSYQSPQPEHEYALAREGTRTRWRPLSSAIESPIF
jgi:hypothetical protein